MTNKEKRKANFAARQQRIAARARTRMALAGINVTSACLPIAGEGAVNSLEPSERTPVGLSKHNLIKGTKLC